MEPFKGVNEMENGLLRNRRGISLVVATVILTAATIVLTVSVAYWMGNVTDIYLELKRLQITSAYATYSPDTGNWTVTVFLKNPGSEDVTICSVLINGKPTFEFSGYAKVTTTLPLTIRTGRENSVNLQLRKGGSFTAGTTIEIRLLSASGLEYPKTVTLN